MRDRKVRTDRERVRSRQIRADDPKAYGDRQRLWKYDLTAEAYDQMIIDQLGLCANPRCGAPLEHIDHDHDCCDVDGKRGNYKTCGSCIRGLLCRNCNLLIGIAGDSPDTLLGAAEYLQQWGR